MKFKMLFVFLINILLLGTWLKPVFALEHTQKNGLFSMDIPREWHWVEFPEEVVITYPDGKTMAIDIQLAPSRKLSLGEVKKTLRESNDRMIKSGIEAHHGTLIDDKEINLDGVYATQLDFKTSSQNPIDVRYISFFDNGYAFTVTYGSEDEKMRLLMDDVIATMRLKK